ncbi:MAG TPA: hypothetical protein VF680_16760 [Allosphingosinicella sp.]|jgi:hypothetical protein
MSYDQCAEFALEYLRLLGSPLSFSDKIACITVKNYKAEAPKDLVHLRGIKFGGVAMRYASDVYHNEEDNVTSELTYTLNNCVIQTSFKDGEIVVSYKAIETDEFGYPLIPDNESFKKGLEYFIIHMYIEPLWAMGKIQDKVFSYYEQKRHFYSGQASTSMMVANLDHLETMMNSINRLIIDVNPQETFYKNFGSKENIIRH